MSVWILSFSIGELAASVDSATEAEIRSAILFNFVRFVEWPDEAYQDEDTISIAIVGDPGIARILKKAEGRRIGERSLRIIEVVVTEDGEKLKNAQLVYFGTSFLYEHFKSELKFPVLTVGEDDLFMTEGAMIALTRDGTRVRFDINLKMLDERGIKVRSQMLRLARKVVEP